jgi:hypothetical protein
MMTCILPGIAAFVIVVAIRTVLYMREKKIPVERITVTEDAGYQQVASPGEHHT